MKKLLTGILLGFSWFGLACDNCNVYLNLSPNDYRNSINLLMRQRMMFGEYSGLGEQIATLHAGHGNDQAFWGKKVFETYQTYELRGNFYIRERWKATAIIPVVNNAQYIADFERYKIQGIADPIGLISYQVYNTRRDTVKKTFSQRLSIGGGIKLPLGKTNLQYENGTPNLDLQPGSGSWDLLTYAAYSFKWRFIGINSNINLKMNGKDQTNYQYGKTINARSDLFVDMGRKKVKVRLSSGFYLERAAWDRTHYGSEGEAYDHEDTGGQILFTNFGARLFVSDFVLFGEFQKTIKSELNGYTQLLTRNKLNVGLTYNF